MIDIFVFDRSSAPQQFRLHRAHDRLCVDVGTRALRARCRDDPDAAHHRLFELFEPDDHAGKVERSKLVARLGDRRLDDECGIDAVSHVVVDRRKDLETSRQFGVVVTARDLDRALEQLLGQSEHLARVAAVEAIDHVGENSAQIGREYSRALALSHRLFDRSQRVVDPARQDVFGKPQHRFGRTCAKHLEHVVIGDLVLAVRHAHLGEREAVSHAAASRLGDETKRLDAIRLALFVEDRTEEFGDLVRRDEAEIKPLATRQNGRRHLLDLRGGEDEHDVFGRLFKRFEKRVERRHGQHVHLVDDIDLVLPL